MSQTQLSNVSKTQSEKLSPRLLKSKQPAVFLTRYVWSRNRPVCPQSSSCKLPLSEKIHTVNPTETKPPRRSPSVSMRPPGSPLWPPRTSRWPQHREASNAPLTETPKCQPTAGSEVWLPSSIRTTFSKPTAQKPTFPQNQIVLSSTHVTGLAPNELLPKGSTEASVTPMMFPAESPVTSDTSFITSASPSAFGSTSKKLVENLQVRNASLRTARKSSAPHGPSQQPTRWPPRSVKWPNRWNKFTSVPRFSCESSAIPTGSISEPLETVSTMQPLMPKPVTSAEISRTSPRAQRNSVHPQVLEHSPVKTSISKDMESSLESSVDSSPLSQRSSQWTDSLETSGMSLIGSTLSSTSPSSPARCSPVLPDQSAFGIPRNKVSGKVNRKSSAHKCTVGSTTSSVSSPRTPEKSRGTFVQSTGHSCNFRKLPGQRSSAKRLQRKLSESSKPPANDKSSSLESITQSVSPCTPVSSTVFLKPEVKLVRSATWPTELILQPKNTYLLQEQLMARKPECESPSTRQRMLSEPTKPSNSATLLSKKSSAGWERERSSAVPLFSPAVVQSVSEYQFLQLSDPPTTIENSLIFPEASEVVDRSLSRPLKILLTLEKASMTVTSPKLQKYSPKLLSSSTVPLKVDATSPSTVSSSLVKLTTAPTPVPEDSVEDTAVLLVCPPTSSRVPAVVGPTAGLGARSRPEAQPQTAPLNLLPMSALSSETSPRSGTTFNVGGSILDTGVWPNLPPSSSQSSKLLSSRGASVNLSPTFSHDHLISPVAQLSLSKEQSSISQDVEKNYPKMLRQSSALPLTESSLVRPLKENSRLMMAPTLSTKFHSRSAFQESSSDVHSSILPSWPTIPETRYSPAMASLGQSGRHWTETNSCLAEQNRHSSHLAVCCPQTESCTQSGNSVFSMSSTLLQAPDLSSQSVPAESGEIRRKSLGSCSTQPSLCLTPHSPSFRPSSYVTCTTNVTVHTAASFPSLYSSSTSVSCSVAQTQSSTLWISGSFTKSVTSQEPMEPISDSRHMPFASSSGAIRSIQSPPLLKKMGDGSEVIPAGSLAAVRLVTSSSWTPSLEIAPSSSQRELFPAGSEISTMPWPSNSCSKQPLMPSDSHSHPSDSLTVPSAAPTRTSARLPASLWSMAPTLPPSITDPKLPMFSWVSRSPLWVPAQTSGSSCTATHVTPACTPSLTRASPTWASSAAQSATVVASSKGPVVSAVVQASVPHSQPSVSWSQNLPAAWSSTRNATTTEVLGFRKGPSSGLVRLPIKYIKRQPLPRTGDIESTSSSTS